MQKQTMGSIDDSYDDAVHALLRSPLHIARSKADLQIISRRRKLFVNDMKVYMNRLGLKISSLPSSVIHVAGTKGKGSTACFCEAILRRRYGLRTGMCTSPHLVDVRERIRINGRIVSKGAFAQAYWDIRTKLDAVAEAVDYSDKTKEGDEGNENELKLERTPNMPGYFSMLTLMAFYIFGNRCKDSVPLDVIIVEVGMGGRYDATNVLEHNKETDVVCGVTLIDLDHTRELGDTVEKIAHHKGGIFRACTEKSFPVNKGKVRFFTTGSNSESVLNVLRQCASEAGEPLRVVQNSGVLRSCQKWDGLLAGGEHQLRNAEMAVALSEALVERMNMRRQATGHADILKPVCTTPESLQDVLCPGRCQTVALLRRWNEITSADSASERDDEQLTYLRLDGAHTEKSMDSCVSWFRSVALSNDDNRKKKIVLIFNCGRDRNPVAMLEILARQRRDNDQPLFDSVYFCRSDFERPTDAPHLSAEELLRDWKKVQSFPCLCDTKTNTAAATSTTWQETLATIWGDLEAVNANPSHLHSQSATNDKKSECKNNISHGLSVKAALDTSSALANEKANTSLRSATLEVLVTGSFLLVASALNAVGWNEYVERT